MERAFAHLRWFRRLRIRWKICDDIHRAFLTLACALVCWRRIKNHRLCCGSGCLQSFGEATEELHFFHDVLRLHLALAQPGKPILGVGCEGA
ncbi:hypothetical protein [Streptomyces sp. A5-4]|uniref:hypothetical protein n=1 Tax=Streptomyces sp. A5-4 TaxID=3384771 RepID=UPI003DA9E881